MGSPLHSGYPGTPIALLFAGASAFMVVKYAVHAYKVRRRIVVQRSPIDDGRLGFIWAFFMIMALLSIWAHYRAPT